MYEIVRYIPQATNGTRLWKHLLYTEQARLPDKLRQVFMLLCKGVNKIVRHKWELKWLDFL